VSRKIIIFFFSFAFCAAGFAQISSQALSGQTINPITTAVPFLLISPDSRQGAMGDCGAATDADINSIHWNGSKLAFAEKRFGFGFTVTPWLRLLVPDINLYYLAGYGKVDKKGNTTVGGSLRYFSLGNIELTNATGVKTGDYKPNEWAADIAVSQKLSKVFSMGIAFRYINSSISRVYFNGSQGNAASTVATDITMYYKSKLFSVGEKKASASAGLAFTNIGAKIKYSNDQNFIPMNMRLGGGFKFHLDDFNTIGYYTDFNKLLVPTPPIYQYSTDPTTGQLSYVIDPATNEKVIAAGKNPNVPVAQGILQSFHDAPGGFKEELQEINISNGIEYWYNNVFAARAGYFYEPKTKGSRQFFTFGAGVKYSIITIDGSFLVPTVLNNPLQKTWRISITFDFDAAKKKDDPAAGAAANP
jgi:hypothetical protein